MSTSKQNYHHGDLRNALIDAGITLLAEKGIAGLSLRQLARKVGVSHNAPYMHFKDKETVLAAIASQGFEKLALAIDDSLQGLDHVPIFDRLQAISLAPVRFALAHPHHFEVMFGSLPATNYPDMLETSLKAFGKLIAVIRAGYDSGELITQEPEHMALVLWTHVHGLSSILIANQIPPDMLADVAIDDMVYANIQMLCTGIMKS